MNINADEHHQHPRHRSILPIINNHHRRDALDTSHFMSGCFQQQGRPCTEIEAHTPYVNSQHSMWRYSAATMRPHVHTAYRHQFWMTNSAALVVANGTLWVYTRYSVFIDHSASNTGCKACTPGVVYCPIPTPYNLTKCPENTPLSLQYIVYIAYFRVTPDLSIASSEEVRLLPYTIDFEWATKANKDPSDGMADPRAFQWGNDMYLLYNQHSMLPNRKYIQGTRQMFIQRINPLHPQEAAHQLIIQGDEPASFGIEKNWSPIDVLRSDIKPDATPDSERPYLFARTVEPFEILACWRNGSCYQAITSSSQRFFDALKKKNNYDDHLHLATNAIRVSPHHYCAIFHARRLPSKPHDIQGRYYAAYVYMFQARPPYAIEYVSRAPLQLSKVGLSPQLQTELVWMSNLAWVDGRIAITCMHGWAAHQSTGVYMMSLHELLYDMIKIG